MCLNGADNAGKPTMLLLKGSLNLQNHVQCITCGTKNTHYWLRYLQSYGLALHQYMDMMLSHVTPAAVGRLSSLCLLI